MNKYLIISCIIFLLFSTSSLSYSGWVGDEIRKRGNQITHPPVPKWRGTSPKKNESYYEYRYENDSSDYDKNKLPTYRPRGRGARELIIPPAPSESEPFKKFHAQYIDSTKSTPDELISKNITNADSELNSKKIGDYSRQSNEKVGALDCDIIFHERNISESLKEKVKQQDGNRCVICGSTKNLEVDHRRALMNGGNNSVGNLGTLCDDCHKEKTKFDKSLRRKRDKICRIK